MSYTVSELQDKDFHPEVAKRIRVVCEALGATEDQVCNVLDIWGRHFKLWGMNQEGQLKYFNEIVQKRNKYGRPGVHCPESFGKP